MLPTECEVVAITGHRKQYYSPEMIDWVVPQLRNTLERLRDERGAKVLNSGMATGADMWAALAAQDLGYELRAFLPFSAEDQRLSWNDKQKQIHQELLAYATEIHVAEPDLPEGKLKFATMQLGYDARNEALVEAADVVVAVCMKRNGGTVNALQHALNYGRPVILLQPKQRTSTVPTPEQLAVRFELDVPDSESVAA